MESERSRSRGQYRNELTANGVANEGEETDAERGRWMGIDKRTANGDGEIQEARACHLE
ncbi:hypothetical protein ACFQMM_21490 [Saliphagus sp. GCM10025308]